MCTKNVPFFSSRSFWTLTSARCLKLCLCCGWGCHTPGSTQPLLCRYGPIFACHCSSEAIFLGRSSVMQSTIPVHSSGVCLHEYVRTYIHTYIFMHDACMHTSMPYDKYIHICCVGMFVRRVLGFYWRHSHLPPFLLS